MTPPAPAPYSITTTRNAGVLVISIAGCLDDEACVGLKQAISSGQVGTSPQIVVEMSGLRYVASAGIAVLIQAQKQLRTVNGALHLCQASEPVHEVFVVLNLASIIPIHRTLAQALMAAAVTNGR
jgi:anti-sigma B factor antagonist